MRYEAQYTSPNEEVAADACPPALLGPSGVEADFGAGLPSGSAAAESTERLVQVLVIEMAYSIPSLHAIRVPQQPVQMCTVPRALDFGCIYVHCFHRVVRSPRY